MRQSPYIPIHLDTIWHFEISRDIGIPYQVVCTHVLCQETTLLWVVECAHNARYNVQAVRYQSTSTQQSNSVNCGII